MNIEWYPGHMAKAKRRMQEEIKKIDIVIELLDARAPRSSENPDIEEIIGSRKRLIVLAKADLASEDVNRLWLEHYRKQGVKAIALDARKGTIRKPLLGAVAALTLDMRERDIARGIAGRRPVRAMVAGIPNVGKSTFINSLRGKAGLRTGDRPGVTRGTQWINVDDTLLILDTPGVLYPGIGSQDISMRLAWIGSVRDEIVDNRELALSLIAFLRERYPEEFQSRYGGEYSDPAETLKYIGKRRGALVAGGDVDLDRAGALVIEDFRKGRIGRISLERPGER